MILSSVRVSSALAEYSTGASLTSFGSEDAMVLPGRRWVLSL